MLCGNDQWSVVKVKEKVGAGTRAKPLGCGCLFLVVLNLIVLKRGVREGTIHRSQGF
ncbi:hypothetical protein PROFUN_01027 [Planoprotostelium fungivorum]|uniref:Uncharacterized protein n=1 Tax=Planoprotostelium fungivorum TaxID=1890364 RepID=A0A2P6N4I2_9EUKA|nr:hypothetical protein PROFUN_01027 [Planoprotostelium fungivorum]